MLIRFTQDYNLSLSRFVRAGDVIDCDSTLAGRLINEGVAEPSYTFLRAVDTALRQSNTTHGSKTVVDFAGAFFKGNTNFQETLDLPCGIDALSLGMTSEASDVSSYTGIKLYAQCTDFSGGATNQNPYLGGVAQAMVSFTFGGAASPTFVAGTVTDPVHIWSDYMPVVNTGPGPSGLIRRSYYPNGVATGAGYGKVDLYGGRSAVLVAQGYHSFYGSVVGADIGATNNATTFAASIAIDPVLLKFATQRKVDSVVQFGDSTRQGWKADGTVAAIERWARKRSAGGRPTAIMNNAVQGQTTDQFVARLERMAAAGHKCELVVYQVASPNDDGGTHTAATSAKQINNGHRAVRATATMGAKLLLDGPFPMSAGTPSAGTQLCINNARQFCLSMAALNPNIRCVMYDELHDPVIYGKWKAMYNASGDGLHENELAVTAVIEPKQGAALNAMLG